MILQSGVLTYEVSGLASDASTTINCFTTPDLGGDQFGAELGMKIPPCNVPDVGGIPASTSKYRCAVWASMAVPLVAFLVTTASDLGRVVMLTAPVNNAAGTEMTGLTLQFTNKSAAGGTISFRVWVGVTHTITR